MAQTPPDGSGALCAQAIKAAQQRVRLPDGLLRAIGLIESGRPSPDGSGPVSWPWTIHVGDEGQFFATKDEAAAAVAALESSGIRSIDIGCMQVNLLHHPGAFVNLDQAFDPEANVLYAAGFLRKLFSRSGSWASAAAAYHSQTPTLAAEYQKRVMGQWGRPAGTFAPLSLRYAAFAPPQVTYRAFAPSTLIFGAFARPASHPMPVHRHGRHVGVSGRQ